MDEQIPEVQEKPKKWLKPLLMLGIFAGLFIITYFATGKNTTFSAIVALIGLVILK